MRFFGSKTPPTAVVAGGTATAPPNTEDTSGVDIETSAAAAANSSPLNSSNINSNNHMATSAADYTAYHAANSDDDDNHHTHPTEKTGLLGGCLRAFTNLNPPKTNNINNINTPSGGSMVVDPPVVAPVLNAREERTYQRLKKIHYWMDESVTICGRKVGLDPVVGLLPVVGDCASAAVSLVLVARAAPDLSRYTTARMLANVWIDAVTGVVPVVGDLFDIGWKANERNVAIFEDHMQQGRQRRHDVDRQWLITVVCFFMVFCVLCTVATIAVTVVLVLLIVQWVSQ